MKRLHAKMAATFILLLALFSSATGAIAFGLGEDKFEKELEKEKEAVKLAREVVKGGYDLVTTEELKSWVDAGKGMLIVDAMPFEDSYKKIHLPGARQFLFPINEMTAWDTKETAGKTQEDFVAFLGPDKDKPLVFYCGFVKCGRSHNGAVWARKLGYKNVYRHPGGIFAWQGAKFSTEGGQ